MKGEKALHLNCMWYAVDWESKGALGNGTHPSLDDKWSSTSEEFSRVWHRCQEVMVAISIVYLRLRAGGQIFEMCGLCVEK